MTVFKVDYEKSHLISEQEEIEFINQVEKIFNLPFPTALEVVLSPSSISRIKYFYSFMKDNRVSKMDFYINSKEDNNSFSPIKENLKFDTNEYQDFGDNFFKTFKTDSIQVSLELMYKKICFTFLYVTSWTEQSFTFSCPIDQIIN